MGEIQKLSFNSKATQVLAKKGEDHFNASGPEQVEGGLTKYALRGRKFRVHKSKYAGQKFIVWAQGTEAAKRVAALNNCLEKCGDKPLYVIGCLREVPVFEDEVRFNDEEIEILV